MKRSSRSAAGAIGEAGACRRERRNQVSEDVMSADSLLRENAELRADRALLRAYLSEARSELNDARAQSAALVEACEALAQFIESYTPDSLLARAQPTFYGIFRVYGKNARAAVQAVRPQADALLARMADLSCQIGEQNTTIGYQDAMLHAAYNALQSYVHGNSAPDLAKEVAAAIQAAIPKARDE
jgi:hypothetical protein